MVLPICVRPIYIKLKRKEKKVFLYFLKVIRRKKGNDYLVVFNIIELVCTVRTSCFRIIYSFCNYFVCLYIHLNCSEYCQIEAVENMNNKK